MVSHQQVKKSVIVLCLLIILLYSAVVAAKQGLASVLVYPARVYLDQWQLQPRKLDQDIWLRLRAQIEESLNLINDDPETLTYMGLTLEGEFLHALTDNNIATEHREAARDYYLEALALQPTWPYYWIKLALVTYRLNGANTDFYATLNHTDKFGPWEPGIQLLIIESGLHHWHSIPDQQKAFFNQVLARTLSGRSNRIKVEKLVAKYALEDAFCQDDKNRISQLECQE